MSMGNFAILFFQTRLLPKTIAIRERMMMAMPPRATLSSSGKKCSWIGNEDEGNLLRKGDKEDVRSTYFFKFLFQYLTLSWSATGLNSLNQWRRQRKIQKGTEFPRLSLGRLYFYSKKYDRDSIYSHIDANEWRRRMTTQLWESVNRKYCCTWKRLLYRLHKIRV